MGFFEDWMNSYSNSPGQMSFADSIASNFGGQGDDLGNFGQQQITEQAPWAQNLLGQNNNMLGQGLATMAEPLGAINQLGAQVNPWHTPGNSWWEGKVDQSRQQGPFSDMGIAQGGPLSTPQDTVPDAANVGGTTPQASLDQALSGNVGAGGFMGATTAPYKAPEGGQFYPFQQGSQGEFSPLTSVTPYTEASPYAGMLDSYLAPFQAERNAWADGTMQSMYGQPDPFGGSVSQVDNSALGGMTGMNNDFLNTIYDMSQTHPDYEYFNPITNNYRRDPVTGQIVPMSQYYGSQG